MKKWLFLTPFFLSIFILKVNAEEENLLDVYPHIVLSNGIIETSIFLPDAEKGFYRSSRFEWSGMIWQLTYKNHTYFTQRVNPHNPENPENGMSLAEEFSIGTSKEIPQRYSDAKPGKTFMKIGVGNLEKPHDDNRYHFGTSYKIVDSGKWKVLHGKDWVEFTHVLSDSYGYSYVYVKRMELTKGKPELIISHSLKNTGAKIIVADQYNHNFFTIDYEPIGKGYSVDLFFPGTTKSNWSPAASIKDNKIIIMEKLENALFGIFEGFNDSVSHNHVIVRNTKTGAGVNISGDFPLSGFNFYSSPVSICPELFVWLYIEPGKTQKWKRIYNFFTE